MKLIIISLLTFFSFLTESYCDVQLDYQKSNSTEKMHVLIKEPYILFANHDYSEKVIFNNSKKQLTMIKKNKKEYFQIDEQSLNEFLNNVDSKVKEGNQMMAEARVKALEKIKDLPPEQQEMARKMMGRLTNTRSPYNARNKPSQQQTEVSYTKTSEQKNVKGHSCDVYKQVRQKAKDRKVCITKPGSLGIKSGEFNIAVNFMNFMKNIRKKFSRRLPFGKIGGVNLSKLNGVPIEFISSKGTPTAELVSNKSGNLPMDHFKIPQDFIKKDFASLSGSMKKFNRKKKNFLNRRPASLSRQDINSISQEDVESQMMQMKNNLMDRLNKATNQNGISFPLGK